MLLRIGEEEAIICATMQGMATLSQRIGTKSLMELFERIQGSELFTMYACIECLTVEGNPNTLAKAIKTPLDIAKVQEAVVVSLSSMLEEEPKNGEPLGTG